MIISGVFGGTKTQTHPCVSSDPNNALSKVQVQRSALHACGTAGALQEDYLENAAEVGSLWFIDPLFINPGAGKASNYHLSSASPLIDVGFGGGNNCEFYLLEPAPNGCARNLGYYGGTDEASTKAGAQHCDCSEED